MNTTHLNFTQHLLCQTLFIYNPNKIRKAIIREKSPMASDKANPRIAYENNCGFNDGFLAYPMIKLPKTVPIPAPDPATPTVAAPAPMNLAAASMSRVGAEVDKEEVGTKAVEVWTTAGLAIICGLRETRATFLNMGRAVLDRLYIMMTDW